MANYPKWEEVRKDLTKLPPGMLGVLQKALSFIVVEDGEEEVAVIFRADPSQYKGKVTDKTPIKLHIDYFEGRNGGLFTIYPLVFDNPAEPMFLEHFVAPYDDAPGLEQSDPYSYESRKKLELILAQDQVNMLAVNFKNQIEFVHRYDFTKKQKKTFAKYKKNLKKYHGKTIATPQFANLIQECINAVPMDKLNRDFLAIG